MKSNSTWRFVLAIVGASLAAAGFICIVVANWNKLTACVASLGKKRSACPEFDDFDDDYTT